MAIAWNEATMATGVKEIDDQHKELISKLGALMDAMSQGKGRTELEPLLDYLGKYAQRHFGFEEECMHRTRCPVADANKKAHAHFIDVFSRTSDQIRRGGSSVSLVISVQKELADWITQHIVRIDTHLRKCVNEA